MSRAIRSFVLEVVLVWRNCGLSAELADEFRFDSWRWRDGFREPGGPVRAFIRADPSSGAHSVPPGPFLRLELEIGNLDESGLTAHVQDEGLERPLTSVIYVQHRQQVCV